MLSGESGDSKMSRKVIDLFSRKVIGWSMNDNMRVELVNDALLMAIWQRKPSCGLL